MTSTEMKQRMGIAVCAAAMIAAASVARAQQMPSEARIKELVRLAAQQVSGGQPTSAVPSVPQPILEDSRPVVQMTLDDAVKLALDRNLNIVVQRQNPASFDPAIASLRATYWPTLTSVVSAASTESPATSNLVGLPVGQSGVTAGTTTYNAGLTENAPWGGGSLAVTLNNLRTTSNSTFVTYSPLYGPSYSAQYIQPLLRGFSIDPNRQQIVVTKIARDISDIQLKSTIINTLSSVREAYWNFVYSVQAVEVARQAVDLAAELVQDNQVRLDVGTMAPLDVITARSQQAQAQVALVTAVATMRTQEIALKQLIVGGAQDTNWSARIDPIDRPEFEPVTVDVEAAVRRALSERTDLQQARKTVDANNVTMKFLKNQLLPQANLVASYGLAGLGGTFQPSAPGTPNPRVPLDIPGGFPGSFAGALGSLLTNTYPSWSIGLNVSLPIGLNVANASMAAAKIEQTQIDAQVHQIELQVAVDVTNAATNVRSTSEAVEAAQAAQELAQKTYEGEQAKFDVGVSTNYNVILELNALNAAKNSYLQAVLNYRNALVEMDRLQQTTLTALNVTLLSPATWAAGSPAVGNLVGSVVGSAR
jgi:outer membrane protein